MNFARIALASIGGFVAVFVVGGLAFTLIPSLKAEFLKISQRLPFAGGHQGHHARRHALHVPRDRRPGCDLRHARPQWHERHASGSPSAQGSPPWGVIDTGKAIPWVEGKTGLTLSESQRDAVKLAPPPQDGRYNRRTRRRQDHPGQQHTPDHQGKTYAGHSMRPDRPGCKAAD